MSENTIFIFLAILLLVLIPQAPKLIKLRIRILRKFNWNRLADWHEKHISVLTQVGRSIMLLVAVVLIGLAL